MGKKWLSQSQIWDDSALQKSWNTAEAEYKKHHSIHVQGGDVEKLLQQLEAEEAEEVDEAEKAEGADMGTSVELPKEEDREVSTQNLATGSNSNAVVHGDQSVDVKGGAETSEAMMTDYTSNHVQDASGSTSAHQSASQLPMPPPFLTSDQDDALKNAMMSWYYAGYYTGLHEGRQSVASNNQQQAEANLGQLPQAPPTS
ncbi:hypothetical protein EV356DRAFT_515843 [Viridothelium virens]|uniref:Survival motor neuron Tudor domain-containing protein n=1 Tax=Viridothelium virens TaxID=1048519 RepID=A0A6A6H7J8_VIRVR|nr:hypothetical protein EV356DRAFT_515843 [Viridothelium virens]